MTESRSWWSSGTLALLLLFVLLPGVASADPASELSAAESRAADAAAEVAVAQQRLDSARADYAAASRRARPVAAAARSARAESRQLTSELREQQLQARAEIAAAEASHRQEEEDHRNEVANEIGLGLALLIAAAIMLAWGRFRASPAVAALVRMQLGQAIALCVGAGFLAVVVGAALPEAGVAGVIGMLLFCLGLILPVALLLARHSLEVERGRSKPIFGRGRIPAWAPRASALLLFLVGVIGLVGAIVSDGPSDPSISAQLREEASSPERGPGAERLEEAEGRTIRAGRKAAAPLAQKQAARTELQKATSAVRRAKALLTAAEADERRSERRLAALVVREEREAARQAEREAEEAEEAEEIEEEELEFFEEEAGGGCDPNYSPCVPAYPPDVDCAEIGGSVSVVGSDPHGLDADSDGIGCE